MTSEKGSALKGKHVLPLDLDRELFNEICTLWATPCEHVSSGMCEQRRPRSASGSTQSDQAPEVIKLFFMLNSAEHEIISSNKYENANNSWHFHFISRENLMLSYV